jgi:hypothetical protein
MIGKLFEKYILKIVEKHIEERAFLIKVIADCASHSITL